MRPLSELPNTEGFRFAGIRHDGSRVECTIERGRWLGPPDGIGGRQIYGLKSFTGWEPVARCAHGVVIGEPCAECYV